jgi:predicted DNA-binding WGR domain protein
MQQDHPSPSPQPELALRHVDPVRGRARAYHLSECRSLFGELALLVTWGRIGRPTRVRIETFDTRTALEARRRTLLERRAAHGYSASTASFS